MINVILARITDAVFEDRLNKSLLFFAAICALLAFLAAMRFGKSDMKVRDIIGGVSLAFLTCGLSAPVAYIALSDSAQQKYGTSLFVGGGTAFVVGAIGIIGLLVTADDSTQIFRKPKMAPLLLGITGLVFIATAFIWHSLENTKHKESGPIVTPSAPSSSAHPVEPPSPHAPAKRATTNPNPSKSPPLHTTDTLEQKSVFMAQLLALYISSHDGISSEMLAGLKLPPVDWLNAELVKYGKTWRVKSTSGPNFVTYDLPQNAEP